MLKHRERQTAAWIGAALSTAALSMVFTTVAITSASAQTPAPAAAAPVAASSDLLFAASFKDFDRQLQPLSQFKGQPMLVYFWATWCKSCKQEVPELKALYDKYKGKNLRVIGISADNTDKVREFARELAINYTLLLGSNDAIELSKKLGNTVGGLPFAVLIDAKGKIVKTVLGEVPPGRFEELVRPMLL